VREFTKSATILGTILSVLLGISNAYLALKAGMTVSASIPAAVGALALFSLFHKRGTILEANIVQTIASAGESLAAAIAFTLPAFFYPFHKHPSVFPWAFGLNGGKFGDNCGDDV